MKKIVASTPGATIFTEGMKVPGQEEREELEAEWMRGDFDPCGDLVVSGRRLERGQGRDADSATGPQPNEWDDVIITLRGTPMADAQDAFYAARGSEAALAERTETSWLVELSNPNLSTHWAHSLRAMSRGDVCRFTCAAKKAQAWLQSLADCCEPLEGAGDAAGARSARGSSVPPARREQVAERAVPPSNNRQMVVDVRLDDWVGVTQVAKHGKAPLFKRVLALPAAVVADARLSKDDKLREELRHAGDFERMQPANELEETQYNESATSAGGRQRRAPRAPDRVTVEYALRTRACVERTGSLTTLDATPLGEPLVFRVGGTLAGGLAPWPVLLEALGNMEEGEGASFSFVADATRVPLAPGDMTGGGGAMVVPGTAPATPAVQPLPSGAVVAAGERLELELRLVRCLRQKEIGGRADGTAFKAKLAAGSGFWRPRVPYLLRFSAAPASASHRDGAGAPKGVTSYEVTLGSSGLSAPLGDLLSTMSLDEAALLTAPRAALARGWPAGGPLHREMPAADADGAVTLWVRLDAMTRVETYGAEDKPADTAADTAAGGDAAAAASSLSVHKETRNGREDIRWLEKAYVAGKGDLPMLDEDVVMVLSMAASDGKGQPLVTADRQLTWRVGDLPYAEDWVLQMLMTMYQGERATIRATGAHASYLLEGMCTLRRAQGGCPVDARAAAEHVAKAGLTLEVTVLSQAPPEPRDGVSAGAVLAAAESLKERANSLLAAGYVPAAMRKYVRATWLLQDGKEEYDPSLPMTEVVGVGRGDEPRRTRFGDAPTLARANALRLALHLNLAHGALKLDENYGALAAARVARTLSPEGVKPRFREAQALVALHDFTTARSLLTELLQMDPQNAPARKLRDEAKAKLAETAAATRRQFTGMFSRAQREGPLYTKDEIARTAAAEMERTRYQADRAEERRRGVQMLDTAALSRLPEEYQQQQIDELNASIENEHRQHEVPAGLTEAQFKRLLQMRTDGEPEARVQEEMARLRREDMEATRKFMLPKEVERMAEAYGALERDRYKSDEVIAEREAEYRAAYDEIKERVSRRKPLFEAEERKQAAMMKEAQEVLDDPLAEEEAKARAVRKMLHEPFHDLDGYLTDAERYELEQCKARPPAEDAQVTKALQRLLGLATERRIEAQIDELMEREDDVLV